MPMFRVELQRRLFRPGESPTNPFLGGIPRPGTTHEVSIRRWEFEAKSEREVRKFIKEAFDHDLPNVRGYTLRSIEQLTENGRGNGVVS